MEEEWEAVGEREDLSSGEVLLLHPKPLSGCLLYSVSHGFVQGDALNSRPAHP